ncbi:MAG TPA: hypothetical protein VGD08_01175 [Stellaceae bacterium]|jgi:hypothetical protein
MRIRVLAALLFALVASAGLESCKGSGPHAEGYKPNAEGPW